MANITITNGVSPVTGFAAGTYNTSIVLAANGYGTTISTDAAGTQTVSTVTVAAGSNTFTYFAQPTNGAATVSVTFSDVGTLGTDVYVRRSNADGTEFYGAVNQIAAGATSTAFSNLPFAGTPEAPAGPVVYFTIDTDTLLTAGYQLAEGETATKEVQVGSSTAEDTIVTFNIVTTAVEPATVQVTLLDGTAGISAEIETEGTAGYAPIGSGTLTIE